MTALRLSLSELRRLSAGFLPRLAIVALAFIPTLYAGLYLYVNADPYSRLGEVPAALVVQDEGDKGDAVAQTLLDDGGFGWIETDEADAEAGVRSGAYDAALVIGPTFSSDLESSGEFTPRQASLTLITDDANNYLARTIADQIVGKVRDSIASEVGTEAAAQFLDGFGEIRSNLSDAASGATTLATGASDAATGASTLATGATSLATGAGTAATGASSLATGAGTAATGASSLATGAGTAATGASSLATGAGTAATGATSLATGASTLETGATALATGATTLETGATSLSTGLATLTTSTTTLPAQAQTLADGASQVADGVATIATYGTTAATEAQTVVDNLDTIRADIAGRLTAAGLTEDQVTTVLTELDTARQPVTDAATALDTASDSLTTLSAGAAQVSDGAASLALAAPLLAQGIADASTGASQVATGATSLSDGADSLAAGATSLSDGADSLATGTTSLSDGADSLATGTQSLSDGADSLATGTQSLSDGADSLATGTQSLSDGATVLDAGAASLATGTSELSDGSADLRDALASGVEAIPLLDSATQAATASTLGNPVVVESEALSAAGTYGAGLAPFFLSLASWIGAYVVFLLVRPLSRRALAASRRSWWTSWATALGGWLTPAVIGVVQMALMFTVAKFALDIDPAYPWLTALYLVLVSATFVAILQMLNVWLGAVGQFLGLVLMLTQLVTAGGTFPWQTIPEPLRSLHRFLPMSYGVDGLRHLLYGGDLGQVVGDATVLAVVLVAALALTSAAARRQQVFTARGLQPELVL
ncbi:YhgE/Pip domain-containing protein [Sanguibacter antarcticus]|uniref:Putative membrane protein n=1 Tax=Sanguibacter antarcticus TaxID=372484 RepID=A0A2A9EAJ5_9MICO|nr:YhgE/Pip domain-containing protein [Sanguibacter antarcticus]PFG35219.1 putative membrane protein [Sanguibacter antarcticus]